MKNYIIVNKLFDFVLRVVKQYQQLVNQEKEYPISKQINRRGTSIETNIEDGVGGYSKNDVTAKRVVDYNKMYEPNQNTQLLTTNKYAEENCMSPWLPFVRSY